MHCGGCKPHSGNMDKSQDELGVLLLSVLDRAFKGEL